MEPEQYQAQQPAITRRRIVVKYIVLPFAVVIFVGAIAIHNGDRPIFSRVFSSDNFGTIQVAPSSSEDGSNMEDDQNFSPTYGSHSVPPLLVPIVSSNHSGASWLLSMLSRGYPDRFCSSAMDQALDPSWERLSSSSSWNAAFNGNIGRSKSDGRHPSQQHQQQHPPEPECSFAYLRNGIQAIAARIRHIVNNSTGVDCLDVAGFISGGGGEEDGDGMILTHDMLTTLCPWFDALRDTNYTADDILNAWLDEYQNGTISIASDENQASSSLWPSSYHCRPCSSLSMHSDAHGDAELQKFWGLTIDSAWLPSWPFDAPWNPVSIRLNSSVLSGAKMVYMRRSNLFARFLGSWYGDYLPSTRTRRTKFWKKNAPPPAARPGIQVDVEDMLAYFAWLEQMDARSLSWVMDQASPEPHIVEYDDCRKSLDACLSGVLQYLGAADPPPPLGYSPNKNVDMEFDDIDDDSSLAILNFVVNAEEVKETVSAHGYESFLGKYLDRPYHEVLLLLYETDPTISRTRPFPGIRTRQYATTSKSQSKWDAAKAILSSLPTDQLVVLGDGDRDVSFLHSYALLTEFKTALRNAPAVFVSASPQCCVPALSSIAPGELFASDGSRSNRVNSCFSSTSLKDEALLCLGDSADHAPLWREFMAGLASSRRPPPSDAQPLFLDSGLLAGAAGDIWQVLSLADIGVEEDATAVLTDLMRYNTSLIHVDYEERLLGRYRPSPIEDATDTTSRTSTPFINQTRALFRQGLKTFGNQTGQSATTRRFPLWNTSGIVLQPILDHIGRLAANTGPKLLDIDYWFGPEVPYIFDEHGLWAVTLVRNRTGADIVKWRLNPIEGIMKTSHDIVMADVESAKRWPAIRKTLQSGVGFPFFAWYGDYKKCNLRNFNDTDSIPILTNSATVGCDYAFPMPSYQQTFDGSTDRFRSEFKNAARQFPWPAKIRKVVWRGSLSDNNSDRIYESVRWRLCQLVFESKNPRYRDMFDVGLTSIPQHNQRAVANLSMVGGLASYISPMTNFQNYIAILDMDGNSWSSRFGSLLCYNSVVLKVEPHYVDYFFDSIRPWRHYVPIRNDLSDLFTTVEYVLDPTNAPVIRDIIATANAWCAARFSPTLMAHDMIDVLESYVRKLDQAKVDWSTDWVAKRAELQSQYSIELV